MRPNYIKIKNPIKKWAEDLNGHFSEDNIQKAKSDMKGCSTLLIQIYNEILPHISQNGWEKAMAPYSSTLAGKSHGRRSLVAAFHGFDKSQTWMNDFTFTFHFHELEKEMATHSSVLAWRIPGTRDPGGLPSMGSHKVGHDWSSLASAAVKMNIIKKIYKQ